MVLEAVPELLVIQLERFIVGLLTTQKRVNCSNYHQNVKRCINHLQVIKIKFKRGAKYFEGEMTSFLTSPTVMEKLMSLKTHV